MTASEQAGAPRGETACAAHPWARLIWLDAARSAALVAMIVFHLFRDLEFFGALPVGTTAQGGWAWAARAIAGSFIFLSGISLVMAHERGFRLQSWARRLALIAAAAALVSGATYLAFPDRFIYFGILHCLAVCALLGAGLLRAPARALWGVAVAVLAAHVLWGRALFDEAWLAWTGLSSTVSPALDFIPLVPWVALFVMGMALARGIPLSRYDLPPALRAGADRLAWPGRHSLAIYLAHQPLLLGLLWIVFSIAG